jgi:preprotein translocase subunit SecA
MVLGVLKKAFGDYNEKELKKLWPLAVEVNDWEEEIFALSDDDLAAKTVEFRKRLADGEALDDILPEAFAVTRESSKRRTGMRHFDVQLIGGIVLHQGKISEMKTGEGKTLVATLALYLTALAGGGAHLVTVNDYLAKRDAQWMGPIFHSLTPARHPGTTLPHLPTYLQPR